MSQFVHKKEREDLLQQHVQRHRLTPVCVCVIKILTHEDKVKSKTKWKGSREIRNKIKFQFTHVALQLILPLMVLFRSLFFRTDTLPPPLLTPFTPVSFTSLFSHSHSVRCNYSDQFNLALKCGYFMLPLTLERDGFFDLQSC